MKSMNDIENKVQSRFGDVLRHIMAIRGIKQNELARLVGKQSRYISDIVGNKSLPSTKLKGEILRVLMVDDLCVSFMEYKLLDYDLTPSQAKVMFKSIGDTFIKEKYNITTIV